VAPPGGQSSVVELPLIGASEHRSLILLVLNEEDGLANTEGEYSLTIMVLSPLAMAWCGLSVDQNLDEEFPMTQGPIPTAMWWRPYPTICR
jgi:hypothetical protein